MNDNTLCLFLLILVGGLLLTSEIEPRSEDCAHNIEAAKGATTIALARTQMKVVLDTSIRDADENQWVFWFKNLQAQNQLLYTSQASQNGINSTSQTTLLKTFRDNLEREESWR